jgi:hypothetical protein
MTVLALGTFLAPALLHFKSRRAESFDNIPQGPTTIHILHAVITLPRQLENGENPNPVAVVYTG